MTGTEIAELAAAGIAAGVLAGLFGVGGGIIFVPALVVVAGLGQVDATATSLLAMIPVVLAGVWRQHVYGNVRWRAGLLVGALSAGGVAGGVALAEALPEHALRILFAVLLLLTAARLVWSQRPRRDAENGSEI